MEAIVNPKKQPMVHTDEFIFPNLTRVDYQFGDYYFIINSQCTPISEFKTRVFTWIAYYVGLPTKPMTSFMKFYTRRVIEQDVEIMKNHVQHLKNFESNTYYSTGADEHHLAIDRMLQTGMKSRSEILKVNISERTRVLDLKDFIELHPQIAEYDESDSSMHKSILKLISKPMKLLGLSLAYERSPSFNALLRAQGIAFLRP